jgi:hypothetical protein
MTTVPSCRHPHFDNGHFAPPASTARRLTKPTSLPSIFARAAIVNLTLLPSRHTRPTTCARGREWVFRRAGTWNRQALSFDPHSREVPSKHLLVPTINEITHHKHKSPEADQWRQQSLVEMVVARPDVDGSVDLSVLSQRSLVSATGVLMPHLHESVRIWT